MKSTKQLLITMAVLLCSLTANAYDFEVDGIYYNISSTDFTAEVTYCINDYSGDVVIPSSLTYYGYEISVIAIGDEAFDFCKSLTSIEIPNTVTSIGDDAFYDCTGLTSVTFGENSQLTTIGNYAFSGCTSLASIEIPNTVTTIGYFAFSGCTSLTSIEIPNTVTTIANYAFSGCTSLTSIEIPNTVTSIYSHAFKGCTSLTSIEIPNSVTSISNGAFSGCTSLTSIEIPNSVTRIWDDAFSGCTSLTSIEIPNSVTSIAAGAFSGCTSLTSIEIPNSVTSISKGDENAGSFENCTSLISVTFEEDSQLTIIEDRAFYGCTSLINIEIPNSVTSIGGFILGGVFCRCTSLTSVTFEENSRLTALGMSMFSGCTSLTSIEIPNTVTSIPFGAFSSCKSLTSIEIPSGVTSIENSAFSGCTSLTSIEIPNSVTYIADYAFSGCTSLTSIEIPNSVTYINEGAFRNCTSLTSIEIPNSVTYINDEVFSGCTSLTSIEIPNSVTYIYSDAFSGCTSLTSIEIPNSVTYIDDDAFSGCTSLKDLFIEDGYATLKLVNVFSNCPLETIYLGRNLSFDNFEYSDDLPFNEARTLKTLTIGKNVTEILGMTFYDCVNLESIYMTSVPPVIKDDTFSNTSYYIATVYVPEGTIAFYKSADVWKNFWNIQEQIYVEYHTITYIVDGEVYATDSLTYGSEIVLRDEPTKEGYTFSGWSEAPETMPAYDVEITGSFSVNTYAITYIVDGEVYATDSLAYGSEIVLIDEPTKEGYTFSGWSEAPETMPANDIEITGSFSVNTYAVTYIVDGEVYATDSLTYGSEIVLIDEPTKEGYTFSGWSETPETMPAEDIEITGSFIPTENVSEVEFDANIQTTNNGIILLNANNNWVRVYTINGILVKKIDNYTGEEITLNKGVYIISVGNKAIKIML